MIRKTKNKMNKLKEMNDRIKIFSLDREADIAEDSNGEIEDGINKWLSEQKNIKIIRIFGKSKNTGSRYNTKYGFIVIHYQISKEKK